MNQKTTFKWEQKYKGITIEVIRWGYSENDSWDFGDRWNSYVYIEKDHNLFDKFNIEDYEDDLTLDRIDEKIKFSGGVTFAQKLFNKEGVCEVKIGNNYNHSCNTDDKKDMNLIFQDLKNTIDELLDNK